MPLYGKHCYLVTKCAFIVAVCNAIFHIYHSGCGPFVMIATHCRIFCGRHKDVWAIAPPAAKADVLSLLPRGLKLPFLALSSWTPVELKHARFIILETETKHSMSLLKAADLAPCLVALFTLIFALNFLPDPTLCWTSLPVCRSRTRQS